MSKPVQAMMRATISARYEGPLPSSSEFAAYGKILPDAPERIMRMAEKQQDHRLAYERLSLRGFVVERLLAQIFAFIFAVTALILAYVCAEKGWMTLAVAIATTTVLGVVGAFLVKRFTSDNEKSE